MARQLLGLGYSDSCNHYFQIGLQQLHRAALKSDLETAANTEYGSMDVDYVVCMDMHSATVLPMAWAASIVPDIV